MFRYLRAAFWARMPVAGLGRVPLNVVAVSGLALLGFGHEGFWLLGAGLEAAYLYTLSASPRFQRVVDAQSVHLKEGEAEKQRALLVARLSQERRARLAELEKKCARIIELDTDSQAESYVLDNNRDALRQMTWLYLKLLVAQQNFVSLQGGDKVEAELQRQIAALESDLREANLSRSLRESKQATLAILEQRRANLDRCEQLLEEIASDLTRVEAQVDLAVEKAGMQGKSEAISANLNLVSQLLDDSVYGEAAPAIAQVERAYEKQ